MNESAANTALAFSVEETLCVGIVWASWRLVILWFVAPGLLVGGGLWWRARALAAEMSPPECARAAPAASRADERGNLVDVASARDGIVDLLGTEIAPKPGEQPPMGAFRREVTVLLTELPATEREPRADCVKIEGRWYRPVGKHDDLRPGKLRIQHVERWFVPVKVAMAVQPGQLLGQLDSSLAVDELSAKLAKLDTAESERVASEKIRDYFEACYKMLLNLGPAANKDEVNEARAGGPFPAGPGPDYRASGPVGHHCQKILEVADAPGYFDPLQGVSRGRRHGDGLEARAGTA
jgi:hypothetical protein